MKPPEFKDYIGDGVYVRFDGYYVWVEAERDGALHSVALEPEVMSNLATYWEGIQDYYESARANKK